MRYLCYFYNIGFSREFDTRAAAEEYGLKAGFEYTVVVLNEETV